MLAISHTIDDFARYVGGGEGGEDESATESTDADAAMGPTDLAVLLESSFPGSIRAEDLGTLVEAVSQGPDGDEVGTAMRAGLARLVHSTRTGDPDVLADAAELMGGAAAAGAERENWLAGLLSPAVLAMAGMTGGNLTDRDQAHARLDALFGPGSSAFDSAHAPGPVLEDLRVLSQCMHLQPRMKEALDQRDIEELVSLLDEMLDLRERTSESSTWQFLVLFLVGQAHLSLAMLDGRVATVRTAVAYIEEATGHPRVPAYARPMLDAFWAGALGLCSLIEPDPARVLEAVARARRSLESRAAMPQQHVVARQTIAFALRAVHTSTGDRSVLEEAVGELERVRRDLTEQSSPVLMQKVLWELAETYRLRGDRERDDLGAAVGTVRESLLVLAEDVLLQLGAEHGLEVARAGASRGLLAAQWAA
ncbi:CHAT domain-containing protein, partial [Streptomyces sp. MCAF7]